MKKVDIFDEDNSMMIENDYSDDTFDFFPDQKILKVSSSIKGDVFYNNSTIEYKISANPVELQMRTIELSHEPPKEWSIKDGVVLESEIKKNKFNTQERIDDLKKEVEWSKVSIFGSPEVNLYILSKHPEIISKEDYRKFLRQSLERVKLGVSKVEEAVKGDTSGLEIYTSESGRNVWYQPPNKLEEKEIEEYWKLSDEKRLESKYGKKFEYAEKFNDSLFKEGSPKYVGISDYEYRTSIAIVEYVEKLLNQKEKPQMAQPVEKISKTKGFVISLLLTLFISWVVSWFVDINPFLIFILVQVVAFVQSILGGWIGKLFE